MAKKTPSERRRRDPRIDEIHTKVEHLHDCIESVKQSVQSNTETVKEVRDILQSFRIAGAIAKWLTGIAAAFMAVKTGITTWGGK